MVGDILLVGEFSTGGTVTTLNAFKWVGGSSPLMSIVATGGADCRTAPAAANFCSRSNTVSVSTPWLTQDKTSVPNTLATAEFFEVGLDLTGIFNGNPPCISRFIFDTRTSPSTTATLVDYAQGALSTCPTSTIFTSVSPSPITLGGSATDTATVTLSTASTVDGTVDFKVYGPVATNAPTCTTLAGSFLGVKIGPGVTPQSATSGLFTPSATGFYFWTATYNPATPRNGNTAFTTCGDGGELLVVASIPKITAFGFTNTPTGNDPTLGSGTVTYTVTIHNYGASGTSVTLSGSLTVSVTSVTASVSCMGGNSATISGPLAGGASEQFSLTCTYSGNSGDEVKATVSAMFTDSNGLIGTVSGSPTTYIFTIQKL